MRRGGGRPHGSIASLLVSGALLEFFPWPSIFALSVVLAALALVGTAAMVPTSKDPEHATIDPAGAVLSVAGIAGVVFAIIEGPALGWASPTVVATFVMGVLALVAFVLWELRSKRPMLDPRLFLVRPFSAGTLSITMSHVAIFGLFFVALQYLQQILGYSPLLSGLAVLPMVAAFALSPAAAHLSERIGPGPVIAGGLTLGAAGLAVLATLGEGSSYWQVLGGFALAGAGMALSAAPATKAIVASLPQGKQGVASAVNDLSRELGGVLGIAILGSVLNAGYRSGLADAARGVPGEALARAQESLASALGVAGQLGGREGSNLELAVRSGGHSSAGHSTTDGGIVLDLSEMKNLEIDLERRTACAATGLTTGEYTAAAGAHGLATGFGDTGSVGIGGITLGGGVGYPVRKHGLTIDNLLAADMVTADGRLLRVDAENHPDLFWAIRGGGGNFGVVTRFQYRLHEVDTVVGGMLVLPATPAVIHSFVAEAEAAPEELSTIANVMTAPPMPFLPEEVHGHSSAGNGEAVSASITKETEKRGKSPAL